MNLEESDGKKVQMIIYAAPLFVFLAATLRLGLEQTLFTFFQSLTIALVVIVFSYSLNKKDDE